MKRFIAITIAALVSSACGEPVREAGTESAPSRGAAQEGPEAAQGAMENEASKQASDVAPKSAADLSPAPKAQPNPAPPPSVASSLPVCAPGQTGPKCLPAAEGPATTTEEAEEVGRQQPQVQVASTVREAEPVVARLTPSFGTLATDVEKRQERINIILDLGRAGGQCELEELLQIVEGEYLPGERTMAVRALGTRGGTGLQVRERLESALPRLKRVCETAPVSVKPQVAALLYRWGEKEYAIPHIEEAVAFGVPLSEAFRLGYIDGNMAYQPEAAPYLIRWLDSKHQHVRLDAGVALLWMGRHEEGMRPFNEGLSADLTKIQRLTTVNYAAGVRGVPGVAEFLQKASQDSDQEVANRARMLLENMPKSVAPVP